MVVNITFLALPIKYPRFRMWNFKKLKQGGLLNLVLYTFVGMITGKYFLSHSVKQFGIKCGRIVYFSGIADHARFFWAVITEIRPNTKGNDIFAVLEPGLKGNNFFRFIMCKISRLR